MAEVGVAVPILNPKALMKKDDFIDYAARVFVSSTDKLPEVEHYAILTNSSRYDGYGGRSPCIEYEGFLNKDELEWEIARLGHTSYKVIKVKPVKVETKIVVDEWSPKTQSFVLQ